MRYSGIKPKQPPEANVYTSSTFFRGLDKAEIRTLLDKATWEEHPARSWLYRQGETPRRLFFLESGLVRLSELSPEGENILLLFRTPGQVFGYFSLAELPSNISSAQVIRRARVAVWDRDAALKMLQSTPQAAMNLFNVAARDVLYFYDRTRRMATQDAGHRVAWAISELASTVGSTTRGGIEIGFAIGQREIAELAGTTIFTVSRELTKLQRQRVLEKRRGHVLILQPEKLLDIIGAH